MPPKLIRITLNRAEPRTHQIEYGESKVEALTDAEQIELEILRKEMKGVVEFRSADKLDSPEELCSSLKRRRLATLEEKLTAETIVWMPQDMVSLEGINTVLLIVRPDWIPVYVENIPSELLDRMFSSTISIGKVFVSSGEDEKVKHPEDLPEEILNEKDPRKQQVLKVVNNIQGISFNKDPWVRLVKFSVGDKGQDFNPAEGKHEGHKTIPGSLYLQAVKWLAVDWGIINSALSRVYGDKVAWHRAKNESYWEIVFGWEEVKP